MESIAPQLEKFAWKSIWSGDWNYIDCSDWGVFFTKEFDLNGKPFVEHAVFLFEKGKVSAWVTEDEVHEFGVRAALAFASSEAEVQALTERMKAGTDAAVAYMNSHENDEASAELYLGYLECIRGYYRNSLPTKYFPDAVSPELLQSYLPYLDDARLYGEPVFTDSVAFDTSFAAKLESKTGIEAKYLLCLTKDELLQYFKDTSLPHLEQLKERNEFGALVFHKGVETVYIGEEARAIHQALLPKANADEVSGATAYPGTVRGKVRIVLTPTKETVFDEGDILVTGMTRPEYIPIMQKAAAFVTDAGGVLSHAAITAREMKKPCVIGTKVATKVFKDGDMVEVDAEKGIVRKL